MRQLWQQLTLLGWGLVPVILAEGLAELFHAISWRYCLSGSHRRIPLTRLFRIHMAGYAVNFLTPTASTAGEVSKAALLAVDRKGPEAITAVLIGKLSFALGHLLFVGAGTLLLLPRLQLPAPLRAALFSGGALLAAGIFIFMLLQKHGRLGNLARWLIARKIFAKTLQRFVQPMEQIDETLKIFYRERPWDLARSVFWHLLGYAVGIFTTWYFIFLLAKGSGFSNAAGIWFLALWFDLLTFAVPLNLGVMEGGRIVAFRTFGFDVSLGMTCGVVTRMAQLFWACFGLISYALLIASHRPHILSKKLSALLRSQRSIVADRVTGNKITKPSNPEIIP